MKLLEKARQFPRWWLDEFRAGWHGGWANTDALSAGIAHDDSVTAARRGDDAASKAHLRKGAAYHDRSTQHRLRSTPGRSR